MKTSLIILALFIAAYCNAQTPFGDVSLAQPTVNAVAASSVSLVQATNRNGFDNKVIAFPNNVTSGNLLVVFFVCQRTETPSQTISDTLGNTWSLLGSTNDNANLVATFMGWYTKTASGGADTITVTSASAASGIMVAEYSGLATGASDGTVVIVANKVGFPTSLTSPTVTTSSGGCVLSAIMSVNGGFTSGNPTIAGAFVVDKRSDYGMGLSRSNTTAGGTFAPVYSFNNGQSPCMISFGLK